MPNAPVGVPEAYDEHVALMFDLLALAYQADLTRVFTFMMAREVSQRTYPEIGVTEPHHSISHHGNRPAAIEGHAKLNAYHVSMFAKFLERLRSTPDGDGSLLDHSIIVYGSGMSDGNGHTGSPLPHVVVGGGAGQHQGQPAHHARRRARRWPTCCWPLRRSAASSRIDSASARAPVELCTRSEIADVHLETSIPRRTVLRGMGAALALPLLDAMVPALTPTVQTAACRAQAAGMRLHPARLHHGPLDARDLGRGLRVHADPQAARTVPRLARRRDQPDEAGTGGVDTNHAGAPASWLAGVPPKRTAGPDFSLGITLDQLVAKHIGQETTFPSIELATEDFSGLVGDCAPGFSCAYMNTLSWQSETAPLPMEINPRSVFEQMFGGGAHGDERLARMRTDRSLLDFVADDLQGRAGRDRRRAIARDWASISITSARSSDAFSAPSSRPQRFPTCRTRRSACPSRSRSMSSCSSTCCVVAYQADLTRVFTFMLGRELSQRTYPHIGVTEPHHSISHHGNRPAAIEMHANVNTYHLTLFAQFVERLNVDRGWRRLAARSLAPALRQRHGERQRALPPICCRRCSSAREPAPSRAIGTSLPAR